MFLHQLFLGVYSSNSNEFEIKIGERILIIQIVDRIATQLSANANHYSSIDDTDDNENDNETVQSSIGLFFGSKAVNFEWTRLVGPGIQFTLCDRTANSQIKRLLYLT